MIDTCFCWDFRYKESSWYVD